MGDPANFNLGEVVTLKAGEAINSNYSVMRELVGGAWELEPDQFVDVSKIAYHHQAVTGKVFLLWVVDKIRVTVKLPIFDAKSALLAERSAAANIHSYK